MSSAQRRYFRSILSVPVFIKPIRQVENLDRPIQMSPVEKLLDVSVGGACIETAQALKPHEMAEILFLLPGQAENVTALAEVVRVSSKGVFFQVGLSFISIGTKEISLIRKFQVEDDTIP